MEPCWKEVKNILTVDLEDWPQSTLDRSLPITHRVVDNTRRMLALFGQYQVRATFFVLGLVAEKYPQLVADILEAGHEVGTHGFGHTPIFLQTPEEFRTDLRRSLAILRNLTTQPVRGYRAPDFSITKQSWWALDILREEGLWYDSSIFPFAGRRYGVPDAPRYVYEVVPGLQEIPLSTVVVSRHRLPTAGGGYLRLFPYAWTDLGIRHMNKEGHPAVVYLHPYEIDPDEYASLRTPVPLPLRLTQFTGRRSVEGKLRHLFSSFRFVPAREALYGNTHS
jgi:polysaccharide deacetylase family protein (PEP-CTERM system associated)